MPQRDNFDVARVLLSPPEPAEEQTSWETC